MKSRPALILTLCAFAALLIVPEAVTDSCRYALRLCAELIVPSLFPFFVLSILLNKLGLPAALGRIISPLASRLYGVSGAGATALIIGLTGGYPLGAAYIADMERGGAISAREGERLLAFCNNSGPAFIIGGVGVGVFHSASLGLMLYGIHILSAVLTGLFFRGDCFEGRSIASADMDAELSSALPAAVGQAVDSVLNVSGFVVCFTVLTGILDARGFISLLCGAVSAGMGAELHFCRAALTALLELGSAVGTMQGLRATPLNLALAAGALGWGGLSVWFQTRCVLSGSNLKGALHIAGRLIGAIIASVLAYSAGSLML